MTLTFYPRVLLLGLALLVVLIGHGASQETRTTADPDLTPEEANEHDEEEEREQRRRTQMMRFSHPGVRSSKEHEERNKGDGGHEQRNKGVGEVYTGTNDHKVLVRDLGLEFAKLLDTLKKKQRPFKCDECKRMGCTGGEEVQGGAGAVGPCDDFFKFSCRDFLANTDAQERLREDWEAYSVNISHLMKRRIGKIAGDIATDKYGRPGDPRYARLLKNASTAYIYKNAGFQGSARFVKQLMNNRYPPASTWPTLWSNLGSEDFNINDLVADYLREDVRPFMYGYTEETANRTQKPLMIGGSHNFITLRLSRDRGRFKTPFSNALIDYYKEMVVEMRELGAWEDSLFEAANRDALNRTTDMYRMSEEEWKEESLRKKAEEEALSERAGRDALEVVQLIYELSLIMPGDTAWMNKDATKRETTLKEMTAQYPYFDFERIFQRLFTKAGVNLDTDGPVVNMFPDFLRKLNDLLTEKDNRTIQNLLAFSYMTSHAFDISKPMKQATKRMYKVFQSSMPRDITMFDLAMSKIVVDKLGFTETSKKYVSAMVENIVAQLRLIILEDRPSSHIRKAAVNQLESMVVKIGHPKKFSHEDLSRHYEDFPDMELGNYFKNRRQLLRVPVVRMLKGMGASPSMSGGWQKPAHRFQVNYNYKTNELVLSAAALQAPMFSLDYPDAKNYGLLGFWIAQQIAQGLITSGNRHFWFRWTDNKEDQCLADQYGGFTLDRIMKNQPIVFTHHPPKSAALKEIATLRLNKSTTLKTAPTDMVALKAAYLAYKSHVRQQHEFRFRYTPPVLTTPGLPDDQIFFASFAQSLCDIHKHFYLKYISQGKAPTPGYARVLYTLQNSDDFAKAFNCPAGSPMNPKYKCQK